MAKDKAYREAEKKIEEAQLSGATELYLSNTELTELPESIGKLTQLQELDVSGNQLTKLPESIGKLKQLKTIWLASTGLNGNPLDEFPRCLRGLEKLEVLGFSRCSLSPMPNWVGEFLNLESLYLHSSNLSDIPPPSPNLSI